VIGCVQLQVVGKIYVHIKCDVCDCMRMSSGHRECGTVFWYVCVCVGAHGVESVALCAGMYACVRE
jgi:hypothetical protein